MFAWLSRRCMRGALFGLGVIPGAVCISGNNNKDNPLMIFNHSGYLEVFIIPVILCTSFVMQVDTNPSSLINDMANTLKTIKVNRKDPSSRANCKIAIKTKADLYMQRNTDPLLGKMPQLVVFPEGSITNSNTIIDFAPGVFFPMQNIQMGIIR